MSSRIAIEILVIETMRALERIQEHAVAEVTQHEKQIDDLKAALKQSIAAHENPSQMMTTIGLIPINSTGMRALDDAFQREIISHFKAIEAQTLSIQHQESRVVEERARRHRLETYIDRIAAVVDGLPPITDDDKNSDALEKIKEILEGIA